MSRLLHFTRLLGLACVVYASQISSAAAQSGCADCGEWLTRPGGGEQAQPSVQNFVPPPANPGMSVFEGGVSGALTDLSSVPGYIEWAAPQTQMRFRFDAMYDNSFPDRAEFIYARAGGPGPGTANRAVFNDSIDLFDARAYLELSDNQRFSVFTDIPVRWIRPSSSIAADSGNTGGLGDIEAGIKYALVNEDDRIITFMLRGYFPSGDGRDGLGTDHFSLEPGLLFQTRISGDTVVFGELRDWIPINGSNFAGNVLRYGVGVGHTMVENCDYSVSPIVEVVGWSVLDGLQTNPNTLAVQGAETTIVNLKAGVRITFPSCGDQDARSLYVGYGRALTGSEWYQDILRVDYSIFF